MLLAGNVPVDASPIPQTTPPSCVQPPDGLVSWWRAEGDATDYQGLNNGTLLGGVGYAAGLVGQAFNMDGSNDFVSIPSNASLNFGRNQPISVDAWVYRSNSIEPQHILGKRTGCGMCNYQLALDGRDSAGHVYFGYCGADEQGSGFKAGDVPLNVWTHIAATFDGSQYRIYINGSMVGESAPGQSLGAMNSADLTIGTSGTCQRPFPGMIDEVELHNRALSAAEIQSIYNAGSAGKCLDNSISGRVTDADQNPISGVDVTADSGQGGTPLTAQTDANGDYTITSVPDGSYTVTASKDGYTFEPPSRDITVPPDATGQDFVGIASSTISGRVTDANQNPIPGVEIIAIPEGPNYSYAAVTDANGDYAIVNVPDGTYTVTASNQSLTFEPPSRAVSVPPNATGQDFTSVPRLSISAQPESVWANGRETTTLTVHLTDAAGQGVPNHLIAIGADSATGAQITTSSDVTNAQGEALFTATSTEVGTVVFTASDASDPTLTDSVSVEFQRRKLVIQFLGINTSLHCDASTGECVTSGASDDFATLRAILRSQYGFEERDFLWYSYRGGLIDYTTGQWQPTSYSCWDTADSYAVSLRHMTDLVNRVAAANLNTDLYLVGHSQGGLIAFQELGFLEGLPDKSRIGGIITLDSPLGGTPSPRTWLTTVITCWNGWQAPSQLTQLYRTVPPSYHDQQGSRALLLCSLPSIRMCAPAANTVAALRAPTFTFGSSDDAVYRPGACEVPGFADITSSQIVGGAGGGLFPLGARPLLLSDCTSESHSRAYTRLAANSAAIIGQQVGFTP